MHKSDIVYSNMSIKFKNDVKSDISDTHLITKHSYKIEPYSINSIFVVHDKIDPGMYISEGNLCTLMGLRVSSAFYNSKKTVRYVSLLNQTNTAVHLPAKFPVCSLHKVTMAGKDIKSGFTQNSNFQMPENLFVQQKDPFLQLIEEYKVIFSLGNSDLGEALGVEHSIDTDGARPIRKHARYKPPKAREEERLHVKDMPIIKSLDPQTKFPSSISPKERQNYKILH